MVESEKIFWRKWEYCNFLLKYSHHQLQLVLQIKVMKSLFTPARTLSISGLESRVLILSFLSLKMMVKRSPEFILKFTEPLQRYLQSCWADNIYFCTGQQQLWKGSVNFKINSRPLFTTIFKLKNVNFKSRDFSPLIEWVLAGVEVLLRTYCCIPYTGPNNVTSDSIWPHLVQCCQICVFKVDKSQKVFFLQNHSWNI